MQFFYHIPYKTHFQTAKEVHQENILFKETAKEPLIFLQKNSNADLKNIKGRKKFLQISIAHTFSLTLHSRKV